MPAHTGSGLRRRRLRAAAAAATLLAALVGVPTIAPAQTSGAEDGRTAIRSAQAAFHQLTAGPKTVKRDGRTFKVRLTATEGFADGLVLLVSEERNPTGVRFSSRSASWSFDVSNVLFPGQTPVRLSTGADRSQIRPFGAVKMTLNVTTIAKSCDGKDMVRRGSLDGDFRLTDPRLPFEEHTLTFSNMPGAVLTSTSGDCLKPPPNGCPTPIQNLHVQRGERSMFVTHTSGVNAVTIVVTPGTTELYRNSEIIGYLNRLTDLKMAWEVDDERSFGWTSQLSGMNLRVEQNWGGPAWVAFIHGPNAAAGQTAFTANEPLQTYSAPCGTGDKQHVQYTREGTAASNFRVDLLFAPTMNFSQIGTLSGTAARTFTQ